MNFELQITNKGKLPTKYQISGDLGTVKTFIKLKVDINKFAWGSVKRIDPLIPGDVEYWVVEKEDGDFSLSVFAFHNVNDSINLNAMRRALDPEYKSPKRNFHDLGEGKF